MADPQVATMIQFAREEVEGEAAQHADASGQSYRERAQVYATLAVAYALRSLEDALGEILPMAGRGI